MGLIGIGFGLGFIFGPAIGGMLGHYQVMGREGALAAFVAAGLSALNLVLAFVTLPESLPPERRGQGAHRPPPAGSAGAARGGRAGPGMKVALVISFFVVFWFSGLEVTFRLFTQDAFGMSMQGTGMLFAFVGVIAVLVQGGLIHPLTRRFGEVRLIRTGAVPAGRRLLPGRHQPEHRRRWFLYCASMLIAGGNGLYNPSFSSYSSRQASAESQGLTLGVVQSMGALARVLGPLTGGLVYEIVGMRGPYFFGAAAWC